MVKLEGVIYKFKEYLLIRGCAPIKDLVKISKRSSSYQGNTDGKHKIDIVNYISNDASYFPEITLARQVTNCQDIWNNIWKNDEKTDNTGKFSITGIVNNANYVSLKMEDQPSNTEKLLRVDGNLRLELFEDSNIEYWHQLVKEAIKEKDENKRKELLNIKAVEERNRIAAKTIVPFTVILSNEEKKDSEKENEDSNKKKYSFGIKIFHDINFKSIPLREEAVLLNLLELNDEDLEKIGSKYLLTKKLVKEVKKGSFDAIHWLKVKEDVNESYFRTTCFRIVQLLLSKKDDFDYQVQKYEMLKQEKCCKLEHGFSFKYETLKHYVDVCDRENSILSVLTYLTKVYEKLGEKDYGNISYLCALVYYSLLETEQLNLFIDWSKRNGINKITTQGDLSRDASLNLITMFDQIQQSKRNEIFISMQFGDSQSELIYEKIYRSVEIFNNKHKTIYLQLVPIRIDRVIGVAESIQENIKKAIQSSGLIIADLSSANINVYQEVGYAMGLAESHNMAPNIILLYKENTEHNKNNKDVDKFIGFNLRSLSQLRFSNYDQLVNGLVERLEKYYEVGC